MDESIYALSAECDAMQDEIARLEAENAELRAGWAACDAALEGMHLLHNQAEAENAELRTQLADVTVSMGRVEKRCAKLRELVCDYGHCMHADCDLCEYDGTESTHCPLSPCFPDIDELRELGIEVD